MLLTLMIAWVAVGGEYMLQCASGETHMIYHCIIANSTARFNHIF